MLRERCKLTPVIGWAPVGVVPYPATNDPADVEAARRRANAADQRSVWSSTLFSDPVCLGRYPEDALRAWGHDFPKFTQSEMKQIHQPLDYFGLNIYQGQPVKSGQYGAGRSPRSRFRSMPTTAHCPPSLCGGAVHERWPPIITENGCRAWTGWLDGAVRPQRIGLRVATFPVTPRIADRLTCAAISTGH
jgi:beta-glucosidase